MVEFVKPTEELLLSIARNMRKADVAEVWASNHHTPRQSILKGWKLSDYAVVVVAPDGTPLVVIGLVKRDLLSGSGVVWMLGCDEALKYKKEFFRQTKPIIDEMLKICPRLCNMVHSKNKVSIQWLKWIGFTVDEPIAYGPEKELFHRFHLERDM